MLLLTLSERLHDVEHDDAVGRRHGGDGGTEQAPGGLRLELVLRNVLGAEEDEDGDGEHQRGVEEEAPEGVRSATLLELRSQQKVMSCTKVLYIQSFYPRTLVMYKVTKERSRAWVRLTKFDSSCGWWAATFRYLLPKQDDEGTC